MDGHHQHNDQGRDLNSKGVWNQHAWKDTSMKVRHGDGTCLKTSSSSALHTICSNISQVLSPCGSTSLLATQKVKTASCRWPTAWQWKGGAINQTKANWTRALSKRPSGLKQPGYKQLYSCPWESKASANGLKKRETKCLMLVQSFYDNRSNEEITNVVKYFCPSQVPSHFEILQLPKETTSWLTGFLLKLPVSVQLR